jgi:hypothetical protein
MATDCLPSSLRALRCQRLRRYLFSPAKIHRLASGPIRKTMGSPSTWERKTFPWRRRRSSMNFPLFWMKASVSPSSGSPELPGGNGRQETSTGESGGFSGGASVSMDSSYAMGAAPC